jgi:hypothetical protein
MVVSSPGRHEGVLVLGQLRESIKRPQVLLWAKLHQEKSVPDVIVKHNFSLH